MKFWNESLNAIYLWINTKMIQFNSIFFAIKNMYTFYLRYQQRIRLLLCLFSTTNSVDLFGMINHL